MMVLTSCVPVPDDPALEWNAVLAQKRRMQRSSPERALLDRQRYVNALRNFVVRHPGHARAREVYREEQIKYATELLERGRYDEAIAVAENVIDRDGADARAAAIRADARSRRAVSSERFSRLSKGMTEADVEKLLGTPPPGWRRVIRRQGAVVTAWYYRRQDGGTAGVFFRNGRVFYSDADGF